MSFPPIGRERNVSKFDTRNGFFFVRTTLQGLPTAYPVTAASAIVCSSTEVALIDEIEINCITSDSNANTDVFLKANGVEVPFHFPGTTDQVQAQRIVWRPRGNLVVQPGQVLAAKTGVLADAHMLIRGRKKPLTAAIRDGDLKGGARLPNLASTYTVDSSATTNGAARQIVPPVAGMAVEILSMVFTGHNYNAAADNALLAFWDGTTGSLAAQGVKVMRAWRQNAPARHAPPLLIGNTDGCIVGPSGWGVYVSATTNIVGATQKADWVITYRYVPADLRAVNDGLRIGASFVPSAGSLPIAAGQPKGRFWVYTEAAVSASGTDSQKDRWFASEPGFDALVKVKGWATSCTALPTLARAQLGMSFGTAGTGVTPLTPDAGLGGYVAVPADAAGTPAAVGTLIGQDETLMVCNVSRIPGFHAYQFAGGEITNRAQLAWGRFEGRKLTSQDTSGQSVFGFISG